jgi:hypothetical protein
MPRLELAPNAGHVCSSCKLRLRREHFNTILLKILRPPLPANDLTGSFFLYQAD